MVVACIFDGNEKRNTVKTCSHDSNGEELPEKKESITSTPHSDRVGKSP